MTTASPNPRASLLSGLRTGGVRSSSASVPHTAAPGGSFNVPRFASQLHTSIFPEEDDDQIIDMPGQTVFTNHQAPRMPMTAAVDGPDNRFTQQQRGLNPNSAPFNPAFLPQQSTHQVPNPALQMQMMQLEIMRMQAIQAQQYQAQLIAQAQLQQQQQQQQSPRRVSFNPPATAGPLSSTFDLRSATLSAQMRRAAQNNAADEQVPMTAALGGKFGSRPNSMSGSSMSRFAAEDYDDALASLPTTPHTTVISGGTSLGSPASNNLNQSGTPSRSDSASTWRRGGNNNSVLSGNNRSPSVKVTPPPVERRVSPPPIGSPTPIGKARPQPLRFSVVASQPMPAVAIDMTEGEIDDPDSSISSKSGSNSNPTTPHSASSNETPLSPREEATKKLYEGLGIGRPASAVAEQQQFASAPGHRMTSQPMRQPRGPPSGADELGPQNFATRIRRQAIGGLGMLMNSRERREFVEAY